MFIDVSELKTYKNCQRQWKLSSRNAFHLRPKATKDVLVFGTLFHEGLHALYATDTPNVDLIVHQLQKELQHDSVQSKVMTNMIIGYASEVLPQDQEQYKVLEIEHGFNFPISMQLDLHARGSIDMIAYDKKTFQIFGFEHKSAKQFKSNLDIKLDEQPRMYTLELARIVEQLQREQPDKPWSLGGIFINEVRKLSTKFDYSRRLCVYTDEQIRRFNEELFQYARKISSEVSDIRNGEYVDIMQPSFLKCQMCDYNTICETYLDNITDLDEIKDEFVEEFGVREEDHLEEKVERKFGVE